MDSAWVCRIAAAVVGMSVVAVLAFAGVATAAASPWAKPDCGGPLPICTEVIDSQGGFGYYVGHDENQLAFYSNTPGSGNHMRYELTMPSDPPGPYSASRSYNFELHGNFWFGLALCDTQSYPEETQQCRPDSDTNIVDLGQHRTAVPGSAFYELQFYPPGWVGAAAGGSSCDPTKWCAAVMINSWSQNPINGQTLNTTCQSEILGGIEYTNYAYLTLDGKPLGPPNPLDFDAASANPDNADTLMLGQGDHVTVTITDTPSGVRALAHDTTTGQTGSMTASAANGFGQIQFAPQGSSCAVLPYDFHPMYSTSSPRTRIYWAAHSTNVTFTDELGHFDFCTQINPQTGSCVGLEGVPGDQESADGDDNFCFDAAASLNYPATGCEDSNDPGFDGPSYQTDWPDGTAEHPTPAAFTSPLTGPQYSDRYSRVGFETDLPRNESPLFFPGGGCDLTTGTGCTNPPNTDDGAPVAFYPYFSSITRRGTDGGDTCHWVLGNFPSAPGVNDFGQDAQFGSLTPLTYYNPPFGASNGATSTAYPDFRKIITNPC